MILLDTSIWLQYFRGSADAAAARELIRRGDVAMHDFVIGEVLLGGLSVDNENLLRSPDPAPNVEAMRVQMLIKEREWRRFAIGWVDACIVASAVVAGIMVASRDNALVSCCPEAGCLYRS